MPSARTVERLARAKVNLTLHVTGRRDDGYHLLDSLVGFVSVGDRLTVAPADDLGLTVTGPEAAAVPVSDDNLVIRAARFLDPDGRAAITLDKRLPTAAGLGGGSSDAATTLTALADLWGLPLPDPAATAVLGADVPVCLHGRACRLQGIGERLAPVPPLPDLEVLLVNPRVPVPTPLVFAGLLHRDNPPMPDMPAWPDARSFCDWLAAQRNDLLPPALRIAPVIGEVLGEIAATAPLHLAMSGSGASCYGLYPPGEAALAAERVRAQRPAWWVAAGRLS